jgi:hypothetical protein
VGRIVSDVQENKIRILKKNTREDQALTSSCAHAHLTLLHPAGEPETIVGVELFDFFTEAEKKGAHGENAFKTLLDKNKIPCLYIGQGIMDVEKSKALLNEEKNDEKSKRPDFLVNLPNLGCIFVDVKNQRRIGFPNKTEQYFSLPSPEIDALHRLHARLLIPVWVAFRDHQSTSDECFHLAPISRIHALKERTLAELPESEKKLLFFFRIPNEVLTKIDGTLALPISGLEQETQENIAQHSTLHRGLFRIIREEINKHIRSNIHKSTLPRAVTRDLSYLFEPEIKEILQELINTGEILYENKKHLRLVGE